ncbi:MAG: hypothetical protein CYPHOPRED_005263 [Cyphobasidiales sp. Tagirdzhanova-0007]|nr:MAG: hypothetical protein CYPHOPRED_005263 [Cyphobasidiales sp. Tagirdzhanova-0007]
MAAANSPLLKAKGPAQAGRQLGTLVVVVYRARNLPNKQRIGKQDPYCACTVGHQKHRTDAIKRGGQTPRWDAQLQFEIWEDAQNEVKAVGTESGGIAPAPNTPVRASSGAPTGDGKENEPPGQAKVGRTAKSSADSATESSSAPASKRMLKVACYADDPREPELIGEGLVDFASILKKGEYDGAVHICNLLWKITLANKEIVLHIEWVKLENKDLCAYEFG